MVGSYGVTREKKYLCCGYCSLALRLMSCVTLSPSVSTTTQWNRRRYRYGIDRSFPPPRGACSSWSFFFLRRRHPGTAGTAGRPDADAPRHPSLSSSEMTVTVVTVYILSLSPTRLLTVRSVESTMPPRITTGIPRAGSCFPLSLSILCVAQAT